MAGIFTMEELKSRWSRYPARHPVWTMVAGLAVALVLVLAIFNWNWAKHPIERIVSNSLDREFRIDGDLDVDFFPLEVHAGKLSLANTAWSDEYTMARTEQLDMQVRFWPLLIGRIILPQLSLKSPYVRLERNNEGVGNWVFGSRSGGCDGADCNSRLRILQLQASKGQLEFREPTLQTSIDLHFDSAKPARKDALAPLTVNGTGTYRRAAFGLSGTVDSPLVLSGKETPYQVDLRARAGATRAHVYGKLSEPLQIRNTAVNLEIQGPDLADLYDFLGIVLPKTPPYKLKGRLTRSGDRFSYDGLAGTVGDSDLSGNVAVDIGGERPKLTAVLKSKVMDFDDLAGFVGGTPGTGEGETASSEQQQAANAQRASGKFLPSAPMHLERLRSMDADVQLTAQRLQSEKLPLESMNAHMKVVNGKMILDPLDFGAAGGKLASVVHVDTRATPAKFALSMKVQQVQLPKLMPKFKLMNDSIGSISGVVDLTGQGESAATVLAASNGNLSVIMGQGQMSNLVLEVAGLDIAEALAFLIGGDQQVTIRCAYADFSVTDGIATTQSVAVDTTDTALLIRGDFSFQDETLDLKLLPRPKDKSPVSIRTPIMIGGTFADPALGPEPGPLLIRGAAVAALAAIAPPLALLGLIETGPGKENYCGPQARQKEKTKSQQRHSSAGKPAS